MNPSGSSWAATRHTSGSNNLTTTKRLIEKQLSAVIQLFEHNAEYLEPSERAWIGYIVGEAASVSGDACSPRRESTSLAISDLRERTRIPGLSPRARSPARIAAESEISALLATSKSLNSVNSLLSCCYDRWAWLKSSQTERADPEIGTNDLQELLGRRRQRMRDRNNVPSSPTALARPPQRDNSTSSGSSRVATTSNDGSDNSLSLVVDGTIERWRQNAEDALNEATARLEAGAAMVQRIPTQQSTHDPYSCRPCIIERRSSVFTPRSDSMLVHTCTAKEGILAQGLNMPTSQPSTRHRDLAHKGDTCRHFSKGQSPKTEQAEEPCFFAPLFRSTLNNSFEKEAIDPISQATKTTISIAPAKSSPAHRAPYRGSHLTTESQAGPIISHATVLTEGGLDLAPGLVPGGTATAFYALPSTLSDVSVQSKTSQDQQVLRSRGRRWLEQQSDCFAATT